VPQVSSEWQSLQNSCMLHFLLLTIKEFVQASPAPLASQIAASVIRVARKGGDARICSMSESRDLII